MRRPTVPDRVLWDAALAGGPRRGVFLAAYGAALFGSAWAALAWTQARRGADAETAALVFLRVWSALLVVAGLLDAASSLLLRAQWSRTIVPAWIEALGPGAAYLDAFLVPVFPAEV